MELYSSTLDKAKKLKFSNTVNLVTMNNISLLSCLSDFVQFWRGIYFGTWALSFGTYQDVNISNYVL